jgi:hypothetical protein
MDLLVQDYIVTDSVDDLRSFSDNKDKEIINRVIKNHYESEEDIGQDLSSFISWFLEYKYPNLFIYVEYNEVNSNVEGYAFKADGVVETVKGLLDMPEEDLPTKINSKDPLTKLITNWRLKNG